MVISSLQNPRIKATVRLRNRRARDREQKILIEGYRELRRAIDNGIAPTELFVCEELFQGENEGALIADIAATGACIIETPATVFQKLAYRDRPEGLLGIAPQFHRCPEDLALRTNAPLLLVAEAIEKPGNLGTMLRTADATGLDGVVVCDQCTDLFNPNVVRSSTGTLFSVPLAEASSENTLAWLRHNNIRILAATPHTDLLYTDADMTTATAVVVGTEQHGLSEAWLREADIQVRIPMLGQADSLNVATATALLLYEAVRQRQQAAGEPEATTKQ